jgi:hypothetical protein
MGFSIAAFPVVASIDCIPDEKQGQNQSPARADWKKKRLSRLKRRQLAIILASPALVLTRDQRNVFCQNQNQGQDFS